MSSITRTANPIVVSPYAPKTPAPRSAPASVDVVQIGDAAPSPAPVRVGRLFAIGFAGLAAATGLASGAQAAGWGAPPTSTSQPAQPNGWGQAAPSAPVASPAQAAPTNGWGQAGPSAPVAAPVQAAPTGGWGQAAPAAPPVQTAPTGGWGQAVPAQPAAPPSGGWGQAVPAQPAPQGWGPSTTKGPSTTAPSTSPQTTVNPGGGWQSAPSATVLGPATYSPAGTELARQALRVYDTQTLYRDWRATDTQLEGMLRVISTAPQTTPAEKALANAALRMGEGKDMLFGSSAQARAAVLRALASNPAGSTAQVLARATLDAHAAVTATPTFDARQVADADHVLGVGLQSMASVGGADEAALGKLGFDMGNHAGMQYANSTQGRLAALREIVTPSQGNIGNRLAIVTHNAFQSATRWDDADRMTLDGLQAILDHPQASVVQKALARLAVQSASNVGQESSARLRDTTTQNLRVIP